MSTSSPSCAPWCREHDGQTCQSRQWTIGGFTLGVSRRGGVVEPTAVDLDHPDGGGSYDLDAAERLGDALRALASLGRIVDRSCVDYWIGRLNAVERRDPEPAS